MSSEPKNPAFQLQNNKITLQTTTLSFLLIQVTEGKNPVPPSQQENTNQRALPICRQSDKLLNKKKKTQ
jgi:hypothetical protein